MCLHTVQRRTKTVIAMGSSLRELSQARIRERAIWRAHHGLFFQPSAVGGRGGLLRVCTLQLPAPAVVYCCSRRQVGLPRLVFSIYRGRHNESVGSPVVHLQLSQLLLKLAQAIVRGVHLAAYSSFPFPPVSDRRGQPRCERAMSVVFGRHRGDGAIIVVIVKDRCATAKSRHPAVFWNSPLQFPDHYAGMRVRGWF